MIAFTRAHSTLAFTLHPTPLHAYPASLSPLGSFACPPHAQRHSLLHPCAHPHPCYLTSTYVGHVACTASPYISVPAPPIRPYTLRVHPTYASAYTYCLIALRPRTLTALAPAPCTRMHSPLGRPVALALIVISPRPLPHTPMHPAHFLTCLCASPARPHPPHHLPLSCQHIRLRPPIHSTTPMALAWPRSPNSVRAQKHHEHSPARAATSQPLDPHRRPPAPAPYACLRALLTILHSLAHTTTYQPLDPDPPPPPAPRAPLRTLLDAPLLHCSLPRGPRAQPLCSCAALNMQQIDCSGLQR
ncbi:hypothetical protein B0H14DRAFT_3431458 [Mycena olivaceomarginata]|nr:hypothetical protein B0H14DRAFT_3431458 [Mycena olivaceomarginata]